MMGTEQVNTSTPEDRLVQKEKGKIEEKHKTTSTTTQLQVPL
jgi:hypothetical protein